VPSYRLHDTTGNDLGLLEHPAPDLEPGDVIVLADEREALVTALVDVHVGELAGLLEVAIAPPEGAKRDERSGDEELDDSRVGERLLVGIEDLMLRILTWPLLWVAFVVTVRRRTRR
jgi:hypothetical protein